MKQNSAIAFLVALVAVIVASCSSRPDYVLSSGEMEDVLYDIHRAHFLPEAMDKSRDDGALQYALMLNVLKQHDVTQTEWDSSMVYYTRHADEMQDIYESLMERYEYEASAMGASVGEGADSTDVWNADRHLLLIPNDMNSSYQWEVKCDTLLEKGEKVTLRFQGLFLNSNMQRRAMAILAMRLKNDSIIVRQQVISQSAVFKLELSDVESLGIKSLSGIFVLSSSTPISLGGSDDKTRSNTSDQVLSITDIMLLHEPKEKPKPVQSPVQPTEPNQNDSSKNEPASQDAQLNPNPLRPSRLQ